ncbi:MAG: hypothetical protein ACYTGC_20385, partial [Planctomycetota bacterium]
PGGSEESCDPFPTDDRFTYVYRLTNSPKSNNTIIGWVIDTLAPGSIVEAGYLAGPGVVPSEVIVNNMHSTVEWRFFDNPIPPDEESVELYIISGRGPALVDATLEGDFALDTPTECLGPAVQCTDCNDNEIPDECETAPDFDPTPPVEAADSCEDAPFICTDYFYWSDNIGATNDLDGWFCGLTYGGFHDVFYKYRPATSGTAVVKVCDGTITPVISVHSDCPATADNVLACNDPVPLTCGVIFEAEAGETYYIRVAGVENTQGTFELQIKGPRCLINPTDRNENGIPDECECLADVNEGLCPGCPEDINGDDIVDVQDLLEVYLNLGPCPFDGGKSVQGPLGTNNDSNPFRTGEDMGGNNGNGGGDGGDPGNPWGNGNG